MNKLELQAVRAFARIIEPINASHDECIEADAGFDAGEFSGPAHDRMLMEEYERVAAVVAPRFGLDADLLLHAYGWWASDQSDRAVRAMITESLASRS
jgi:hypothetical protein